MALKQHGRCWAEEWRWEGSLPTGQLTPDLANPDNEMATDNSREKMDQKKDHVDATEDQGSKSTNATWTGNDGAGVGSATTSHGDPYETREWTENVAETESGTVDAKDNAVRLHGVWAVTEPNRTPEMPLVLVVENVHDLSPSTLLLGPNSCLGNRTSHRDECVAAWRCLAHRLGSKSGVLNLRRMG